MPLEDQSDHPRRRRHLGGEVLVGRAPGIGAGAGVGERREALFYTFTNLPEGGGYYVCVTAEDDLGNRTGATPFGYNEFGQPITSGFLAWTGTNIGGNWSGSSCGAFNHPVFFAFSMTGQVNASGGNWLQLNEPDCTRSYRLYCISPLIDKSQPGAFQISAPSGTICGASPLVTWTASQWADCYHLKLASDTVCTQVVRSHVQPGAPRWEPDPLPAGDYFLCIESEVANGTRRAADNNCGDWTTSNPDAFVPLGKVARSFTGASYTNCTTPQRLFCIGPPTAP